MPAMFSDNAVLQQGREVPVWGRAKPETTVRVEILDQIVETRAGKDGKWSVTLDPMQVNTVPTTMTITDGYGMKEIKISSWERSGSVPANRIWSTPSKKVLPPGASIQTLR
jgi:hypothetical protein